MRCVLVALLLVAGAAEARDRRCGHNRTNRTGDCEGYAFFEAFPATGAGTSGACSTTAPTGAKGEALTFSRTGNATCTKTASGGLSTTGIANGDLVVLSGNQARVEYDSQGVLGLRVESSRTNYLQHSEAFDNIAWTLQGVSASVPVVTANAGTAPDGTTTAERVQFGACSTDPSASAVNQTAGAGLSVVSSVYVRGFNGTSGSISICNYGTAKSDSYCTLCAYSGSSWTRCVQPIAGNSNQLTTIGCNNNSTAYNGSGNTGAADVLLWGADAEQVGVVGTSYVTSYIPTTTAAVTRNAEVPTINGNALSLPAARYSLAASIQTLAPGAVSRGIVEGQVGASSGVGFFTVAGFLRTQNLTAGADNTTDFAWTPNASQLYRVATFNDGTNQSTIIDGTTVIGPVARTPPDSPWSTTTGIGYAPAFPVQLDGIISRVCVDPSPTRCR